MYNYIHLYERRHSRDGRCENVNSVQRPYLSNNCLTFAQFLQAGSKFGAVLPEYCCILLYVSFNDSMSAHAE